MQKMNWIRIVLCGWVTGVVWFSLSMLSLGFARAVLSQELLELIEVGGPHERWDGSISFGIDLAMGIWTMWLYSVIASKNRNGPVAASVAAVAWWTIKSLQSAKWAGLGFLPLNAGLIVPLATTLVSMVVATVIGAWLYDKVELPYEKRKARA